MTEPRKRRYWALVWGDVTEDGTITGNVGRSLKNRKMMTVFPDGDYGKHAITHYKVLERFGLVTLVECKLENGKKHIKLEHILNTWGIHFSTIWSMVVISF